MSLDDPRFREADAIFARALELPPAEWPGFLSRECEDAEIRALVERLLASVESEKSFLRTAGALDGPLAAAAEGSLVAAAALWEPGATIGAYRLVRRIAEGGMGEVWEAEQQEPVRRSVALKLIKAGLDTRQVVARFESERQALALMKHPNIAHAYDAGATEGGRPFFVMELVAGDPITTYCDAERLDIEGRLRLFLQVCDGIQHAHHRGIVHRDIKPSNVLVGTDEGSAVPKIIDFGVARATEQKLTDSSVFTELGQIVGTPDYMSPEQADLTTVDVDTRSDVYSLGVLLYELLTGLRPFDSEELRAGGFEQLLKTLREVDPARPSVRLRSRSEDADALAARRRVDATGLTRILAGDLDWIVMRALEKERDRRYDSPRELALDIERFLDHQPVSASPPTTFYRAKKFARRHRGALVATGFVLLALVAGLVGTSVGLVRAREQADKARTQAAIAEAVNTFLNEDLLSAVAPEEQGIDVTMRAVLDRAAERVEGRFPDQPLVEASVRQTVGRTYMTLGELKEAEPHLRRALELSREHSGNETLESAGVMETLAELLFYVGKKEECEQLFRESLSIMRAQLGSEDSRTLATMVNLGTILLDVSELEEAERIFREALVTAQATLDEDDSTTLTVRHNLGYVLYFNGHHEEAAEQLRAAVEGSQRAMGEDHPATLSSMSVLGTVLRALERFDEAATWTTRTLEARQRVLGPDHPRTLLTHNNVAVALVDAERFDEAEEHYRMALAGQREALGEDHDDTVLTKANYGELLGKLRRFDEARSLLDEALESCRRADPVRSSLHASTLRKLAGVLERQELYGPAENALLDSWKIASDAYGEDSSNARGVVEFLVKFYEARDRPEDASAWRARLSEEE